jgi:uncharacterized protein YdhG (YjbR/CyaY superfamily)
MPSSGFTSIDDYIASQPRAAQPVLRRVRAAIRKAVPDAEETISYQMPAFRLRGRILLYFAAWKEHYSLYPASDAMIAAIPRLAPHRASKGTVRLPFTAPVPATLVERVARFRAAELADAARARRPTKAKRPAKRSR